MAELNHNQQRIVNRYYEHKDTIMGNKLSEIVSDLFLSEDPKKTDRLWKSAETALRNLQVPESRLTLVVAGRDVKKLAELVNEIAVSGTAKSPTAAASAPPPQTPAGAAVITHETLKSALKAFRKRMKLTRLDDESQIGSSRNPLTAGARSSVVAIQPPRQYPREVWEELVRQGKLTSEGQGFYKLAPGA